MLTFWNFYKKLYRTGSSRLYDYLPFYFLISLNKFNLFVCIFEKKKTYKKSIMLI